MYFTHLALEHFRRFVFWEHTFTPGVHLIVGPNARGKTTLLEAASYLTTFSSFLARQPRQLVNQTLALQHPLLVTRLRATFWREEGDAHRERRMEVRLIWRREPTGQARTQKEIRVDDVKRTAAEALGVVQTVLFLPHMLHIVDGAPELRRRYLNLSIAPGDPQYAYALAQYTKALQQRNALLKVLWDTRGDLEQLEIWDQVLSQHGAYLIWTRYRTLQHWNLLADERGWNRLGNGEVLRLVYWPSLGNGPEDENNHQVPLPFHVPEVSLPASEKGVRQMLLERLRQRRPLDLQRGHTTLGPHRDDFRFLVSGMDLATFGSRGQMRSALLMLKLVEAAWYHGKTGVRPVILLDEVLAELDADRRRRVMEAFLDFGEQIWVTTTEPDLFPADLVADLHIWKLHDTGLDPW